MGKQGQVDSEPLIYSQAWLETPLEDVRADTVALNRFLFVRRLIQVSRSWRTLLSTSLHDTGARKTGWQTLFWLSLSGPTATQRELARRIGVRESTIARALDALQEQGLVERQAIKGDRRVNAVALTEAAQPAIEEINKKAKALRDQILSAIDPEDLATAVRVFGIVAGKLAEIEQQAPARQKGPATEDRHEGR
jgi:MarR family transcriptional regulator for hemolysin